MTNRFKFRVYDKKKKVWLLGAGDPQYPSLDGFSLFGECMLFGEWQAVLQEYLTKDRFEDLAVMQSTGLKDRNGKLIFEGDIIQNNDKIPFDVIWTDGRYEAGGFTLHAELTEEQAEIIGNIYENPELLKPESP